MTEEAHKSIKEALEYGIGNAPASWSSNIFIDALAALDTIQQPDLVYGKTPNTSDKETCVCSGSDKSIREALERNSNVLDHFIACFQCGKEPIPAAIKQAEIFLKQAQEALSAHLSQAGGVSDAYKSHEKIIREFLPDWDLQGTVELDVGNLQAIAARIANAQSAPDGWQPIETAPRDGTRFTVWDKIHGHAVYQISWNGRNFSSYNEQWSGSFDFWHAPPTAPHGAAKGGL